MKECQQCKRCYADEVAACPEDGQTTFHSISGEPVLEGKYKLERRLGQGGMGVVYCARHAYLKTQHAIKVILPDLVGNDPQLVTRFRQEALAAAAIRHGNVIAVTDFGVVQGTMPFLVMEYVEGDSLHEMLAREKRLSPERAVELMTAICAGVGAAHRQGIVHRDLKPLNIMICKDKETMAEAVKILDFGLAKIKSGELLGSFIQAQTTGLMGSPYYMAPEQWADEEPDAQADIYSLGVMLFQMLAGDVPFKGSSIPAIMKKHLSDAPPSFAEFGVQVAPQVELAVRHTLEKDRHKRTQTVEQMVEELQTAVGYASKSLAASASQKSSAALPVSSIHILSSPPQSNVYVDSVAVGQTQANGWLLLEGLQSGNHRLRVSKEGFQDWENEILCDGRPQQVVAELRNAGAAPAANQTAETSLFSQTNQAANTFNTPQSLNAVQQTQGFAQQTAPPHQLQDAAAQSAFAQSESRPKPKKGLFSPLLLAIIGISGLLLLTAIGVVSAYWMGLIGRTTALGNGNTNASPTPTVASTPPIEIKTEMVKIEGGKFKMGRNDGAPQEQPEHEVEVPPFWLDKTEVTNAEYHSFVTQTKHPHPVHWLNGAIPAGQEAFPVVNVSLDDVKAFAEWRSKRDGAKYRLPSEEEWEYAARNGGENNLYPWGDKWENQRAIIDQTAPRAVGSIAGGANKWGVQDLIGNVWEWTNSKIKPYPNSNVGFSKPDNMVIRGGGYTSKSTGERAITSTTRYDVPPDRRDGLLGFRLARSD
ncbi:MAG TPA: SUMF1/EgtB/PvdO family nonheme iron enzyme [Pyrinomonadaceae bacterium]|jgi:serine/threonine protein kinase